MRVSVLAAIDQRLHHRRAGAEGNGTEQRLRRWKARLEQTLLYRADGTQSFEGHTRAMDLDDHATPVCQPQSIHLANADLDELRRLDPGPQLQGNT